MLLRDNPVLTRELLVTLRSPRSFVLQLLYVCVLGALVYFHWPAGEEGARQVSPGVARALFDIFFLGQFFLVALMAPDLRRGEHHGREGTEDLRAAAGQPAAARRRSWSASCLSSLSYLVILIVSSLPLMILCYLLGGLLLSEITRSYLVLILAAGTFGLLSVACSSYFRRTSSALVVSYLVILPLAVLCVVLTRTDNVDRSRLRLDRDPAALVPGRLDGARHPDQPAPASSAGRRQRGQGRRRRRGGDEIRDRRRDRSRPVPRQALRAGQAHRPDARRHQPRSRQGAAQRDLQPGNADAAGRDPGQHGAVDSARWRCLLFLRSDKAAYYVAYVLTFNLLVGPVFSAGSITQERERQTLSLLLTTLLRPGQDRVRQADGRAAGLDRADVPADRADAAGLYPAARAARSLLDAAGLSC